MSVVPIINQGTIIIENGDGGDGEPSVTTHAITVSDTENGSISPSGTSGTITVNETSDAAFTITPDSGYKIDEVIVDDAPAEVGDDDTYSYSVNADTGVGSYTFKNVTAPHSIKATFADAISIRDSDGNPLSKVDFGIFHANDFAAPDAKEITIHNDSSTEVSLGEPSIDDPFGIEPAGSQTTIPAGGSATFTVSAKGNLPLGEYEKSFDVAVGGRTISIPVTLNSYYGIYNNTDDGFNLIKPILIGVGIWFGETQVSPKGFIQMKTMHRAGDRPDSGQFNVEIQYGMELKPGYELKDFSIKYVNSDGEFYAPERTLSSFMQNYSVHRRFDSLIYSLFSSNGPSQYFDEGKQGDIYIYATTQPTTYDLTPAASLNGDHGEITLSGSADITHVSAFTDVTFKVTPDKGYRVTQLFDGATSLEPGIEGGYTVDDDGIASYTVENITAVHRLRAEYAGNLYSVSFDARGGSDVSPSKIDVTFMEEYGGSEDLPDGKLPVTSKENYDFDGWYLEPDGKDITQPTRIDENSIVNVGYAHTLYAHFTGKSYKLNFETNGGTSVASKDVEYGTAYGTLPTTAKEGYTFGGWYTDEQYQTKATDKDIFTAPGNITLYAKWTAVTGPPVDDKKPTETDPSDDGKKPADIVQINTGGGSKVAANIGDMVGKIKKPTKKGYKFKGWYTKAKGGKKISDSTKITAGTEIFAQWTANKYKIKYDAGKGKVKPKSKQVTFDGKYGKLAKPTRPGYTFKGWYTKKSGGKKITAGSKVNITKTTTLYAHWKKK